MIEDIKLDEFPKEAGVYLFKVNDEIIYIGSSKNLYSRMVKHRSNIRKCGDHNGTSKQELYQLLQSNTFAVEFQLTNDYRQLEQELIEKYNPKYNAIRAYTGCGTRNGREAEYNKERYQKYKEEILEQNKQYRESHKEGMKQYNNQYYSQLCCFNGETLTLNALRLRFKRKGISNPLKEARKYIKNNNPIEFYDIYP